MIEIGQKAPDFSLPSTSGEEVKLSDFRGKNVVLYFYPKDMTPGCTTEACNFRDSFEPFTSLDTIILGISPDPIDKHQKFIAKHNLNFLLLSDVDHQAAESYGVWKLKKSFGQEKMGIERSTFIIDIEGNVVKEFRKVKVQGHVDEVLQYVKTNLS
ncbi:thioredoxin-dependent thiol peroxidase [Ammoniphilus sp. 3BR4]|uniref:thioredoxin-dependent thiol peroxidase n=1 Tax=Ammoniphilus sp. 3BR4 TaxID=3158265 RepID=UPI003465478F